MKLNVYTDGSGTTRGPGGIAYVAYHETGEPHSEGSLPLDEATNQKAEILAAAYALHSLPEGSDVTIYSDSEYVVKGASQWLAGWLARDWRKTDGGRVSNRAHWQRLIDATSRHASVRYQWIEGHAGIAGNERADKLAGEARAVAKARASERTNEAAILADCEHLVATGQAIWVATEEEYEAAGPIGRKPFDLGAHLRKQEEKRRVDSAIADIPADAGNDDSPELDQAALFDTPSAARRREVYG